MSWTKIKWKNSHLHSHQCYVHISLVIIPHTGGMATLSYFHHSWLYRFYAIRIFFPTPFYAKHRSKWVCDMVQVCHPCNFSIIRRCWLNSLKKKKDCCWLWAPGRLALSLAHMHTLSQGFHFFHEIIFQDFSRTVRPFHRLHYESSYHHIHK